MPRAASISPCPSHLIKDMERLMLTNQRPKLRSVTVWTIRMRGTSYWDDLKHLQSSKIGQAARSRRPGSPTATILWPREGGLQNTKRLTLTFPLRGPADTGRLSEGQVKQGRLCRHFSRVFRENSPPQGPVYEFTRIDQGGQIDQSTGRQTGN